MLKRLVISTLLLLTIFPLAFAQVETKLADSDTTFHRLYVQGAGKNSQEDESFREDKDELKNDLEQDENQASDSTSRELDEPTKDQLRDALNELKEIAEPGDEVTIYFTGHGGGGPQYGTADGDEPFDESFGLNKGPDGQPGQGDDEKLTDDELADMIEGFKESVTIVIIMDSCFGGGFTGGTDDIQESDHVSVIGTSTTCPYDPPGIFGGLVETLGESIADGAGEKECDSNGDGIVTAQELKDCLREQGWQLGPPDDNATSTVNTGKSKCTGSDGQPCSLPSIMSESSVASPGSEITIVGSNFSPDSEIHLRMVDAEFVESEIGITESNSNGSFIFDIKTSDFEEGPYLIVATDMNDHASWVATEISSEPVLVSKPVLVDISGNHIERPEMGAQVLVQSNIASNLYLNQKFIYIMQVKDEQDTTIFISWLSGELFPRQSFDVAQSWTADFQGKYQIEAFVWNSIDSPLPLSAKNSIPVTIG